MINTETHISSELGNWSTSSYNVGIGKQLGRQPVVHVHPPAPYTRSNQGRSTTNVINSYSPSILRERHYSPAPTYTSGFTFSGFRFPKVTLLSFRSPIAITSSLGAIMSIGLFCLGIASQSPLLALFGLVGLTCGLSSNVIVHRHSH